MTNKNIFRLQRMKTDQVLSVIAILVILFLLFKQVSPYGGMASKKEACCGRNGPIEAY
jgi:hypothetical protein